MFATRWVEQRCGVIPVVDGFHRLLLCHCLSSCSVCSLLPELAWFLDLMSCVSPFTYFSVVLVDVHCLASVCFFQLPLFDA